MIKSTFFLLISIFLTPVSPLMHGFTDPLLRIRHMIPPTIIPKEHTQNREIQVFEAKDTTPAITPCLLFYVVLYEVLVVVVAAVLSIIKCECVSPQRGLVICSFVHTDSK